jgi:hypothetical protein
MSRNAVNYIMTEFGRIACGESGAGRPLLLTQRFRATMDDRDPELIAWRTPARDLGVPGAPEQDPRSRL